MSLRYQDGYIQNPYIFNPVNSYSNNQNYHQRAQQSPILNNNFMTNQNISNKIYQSLTLDKNTNPRPNQNKISYAKNEKNKLIEFGRTQKIKKEQQRQNYKRELEQQIQADKERKLKEKEKIQQEQLQRERKFYAEIQIKAKQPKKKEQPSYIILRSGKGSRKKEHNTNGKSLNQSRVTDINETTKPVSSDIKIPKIMKRGGYHNQSALDPTSFKNQEQKQQILNPQQSIKSRIRISPYKTKHQTQIQQRQLQIIKERNYEQQRITNIIRLQQKMIRKLDNFRQQILKTNKNLDIDRQVQQIRNVLKSKPIKLDAWSARNDSIFQNYKDFYHFPKIQPINLSRSRNRQNRSRIQQGIDLNQQETDVRRTFTEQNPQVQNQYHKDIEDLPPMSGKRNRQIKLFKRENDKNYEEERQNEANQQMRIPVVFQKRDESQNPNQQRSQYD